MEHDQNQVESIVEFLNKDGWDKTVLKDHLDKDNCYHVTRILERLTHPLEEKNLDGCLVDLDNLRLNKLGSCVEIERSPLKRY